MSTITLVLALWIPGAEPKPWSDDAQALARQACVRISDAAATRFGSGVVVARRDGSYYVLTANHAVANAKELRVCPFPKDLSPATGKPLGGVEVLVQSVDLDFALIRVPAGADRLTPLVIPPPASKIPAANFDALSVGCDADGSPECRREKISGKRLLRRADGASVFAWEAQQKPDTGRSGGPLLDSQGRVIGICIGTQDAKGYYCHLDEIHAVLKAKKFDWLWQNGKE